MKRDTIYFTKNKNKTNIKGKVNAIGFIEGNSHILYIPSLKLSSYGDSLEEARKMIIMVLNQFTKDLSVLNQDKAESMLADLGWGQQRYFKKRMVNLSETTFDDIKKQFNLPDETEVEQMSIAV